MNETRRSARTLALLLLLGPLAACEPEEPEIEPAADPGAMDGLTREQIQARAEAMSPARAESLGIVDTTIRIADPYPGVDVPDPGAPPTLPAREGAPVTPPAPEGAPRRP